MALEFHSLGLILSISMTSCSFIGSFKKIPFIPLCKGGYSYTQFFLVLHDLVQLPLFEKACSEPSRREGRRGDLRSIDDYHLKSAAVDCANQYFVDRCNLRAALLARRMAFLPFAAL